MFNLFKKKSRSEVLQKKYQKLLKEAFELSKINRAESDKKYAEAEEVNREIASLDQNGSS